ncbi:MAG: penicillin-binding transpeptidase domain-containing protein [Brevinema sp.]
MNCYRYIMVLVLLLSSCSDKKINDKFVEEEKWIEQMFINYQYSDDASFILYDPEIDNQMIYNYTRANMRFVPGSTFKFVNSVIALSEKVVSNIDEVFYKYKGENVYLDDWTNNMNLRQAFKSSNVPAYQQLAKKISLTKMNNYITKFEYGNQNIGTIVNSFWLEGPLMISAVEQTKWLTKLLNGTLVDQKIVEQIKEISYIEVLKDNWKLYGKTGWAKDVGWFVGWIEKDDKLLPFALNIDISDFALLSIRESIAKSILLGYIDKISSKDNE